MTKRFRPIMIMANLPKWKDLRQAVTVPLVIPLVAFQPAYSQQSSSDAALSKAEPAMAGGGMTDSDAPANAAAGAEETPRMIGGFMGIGAKPAADLEDEQMAAPQDGVTAETGSLIEWKTGDQVQLQGALNTTRGVGGRGGGAGAVAAMPMATDPAASCLVYPPHADSKRLEREAEGFPKRRVMVELVPGDDGVAGGLAARALRMASDRDERCLVPPPDLERDRLKYPSGLQAVVYEGAGSSGPDVPPDCMLAECDPPAPDVDGAEASAPIRGFDDGGITGSGSPH